MKIEVTAAPATKTISYKDLPNGTVFHSVKDNIYLKVSDGLVTIRNSFCEGLFLHDSLCGAVEVKTIYDARLVLTPMKP